MSTRRPRRALRYPVRLELKEVNGQPGAGNYLLDISAKGAKLDSSIPFILRDPIQISFIVPGEEKEIHLGGQVVWVQSQHLDLPRYLIGIKLFQTFWELDLLARRWHGLTPTT